NYYITLCVMIPEMCYRFVLSAPETNLRTREATRAVVLARTELSKGPAAVGWPAPGFCRWTRADAAAAGLPSPVTGRRARCSEPGSRPSALEMSVAEMRIAPDFGAVPIVPRGAHAFPPSKLTSWRCFHAVRYVVGSTAPS